MQATLPLWASLVVGPAVGAVIALLGAFGGPWLKVRLMGDKPPANKAGGLSGQDKVDRMRRRVEAVEAYMRVTLASLLVIGTLGAVFVGIVVRINPQNLAQYLAPVSGLAGIAVGYFFGKVASTTKT